LVEGVLITLTGFNSTTPYGQSRGSLDHSPVHLLGAL
jgi:hypothetical protein